MGVITALAAFEHTYAQDVPGLALPWTAAPVAEPELLVLNEELAAELGLDADALRAPAGRALLVGDGVPEARSRWHTPGTSSATTPPPRRRPGAAAR